MATLTINVPNGDAVSTLIPVLTDRLAQRGIATVGLTQVQIAGRFVAETLKDIYKDEKRRAAMLSVQANIDTALATAETTAAGITGA